MCVCMYVCVHECVWVFISPALPSGKKMFTSSGKPTPGSNLPLVTSTFTAISSVKLSKFVLATMTRTVSVWDTSGNGLNQSFETQRTSLEFTYRRCRELR